MQQKEKRKPEWITVFWDCLIIGKKHVLGAQNNVSGCTVSHVENMGRLSQHVYPGIDVDIISAIYGSQYSQT